MIDPRKTRHDTRGALRSMARAIRSLAQQVQEQRKEIAAMRREGVPLRSQLDVRDFGAISDPVADRVAQIENRLRGRN